MASYYRTIKGKKYDRHLLDLAEEAVKGQGDGRISIDDAKKLIVASKDNDVITNVERATIEYIHKNFSFTPEAKKFFDAEINKITGSGQTKKAGSGKKSTASASRKKAIPAKNILDKDKQDDKAKNKVQAITEAKDLIREQGSSVPQKETVERQPVEKENIQYMNRKGILIGALVFLLILVLLISFKNCNRNKDKQPIQAEKNLPVDNRNADNNKKEKDEIAKSVVKNENKESKKQENKKETSPPTKATQPVENKKSIVGKKSENKAGQQTEKKQNVPTGNVYIVQVGDTLIKIAQTKLGNESKWRMIYERNQKQIQDPNVIQIGQKLNLPN